MLVAVYGTLKRGKWNHHRLGNSPFVQEDRIHGYKLYNAGFPVAVPAVASSAVEVFDIGDDMEVLESLDMLEGYRGEGKDNFYDRVVVQTRSGLTASVYVAGTGWRRDFDELPECPVVDGAYLWGG